MWQLFVTILRCFIPVMLLMNTHFVIVRHTHKTKIQSISLQVPACSKPPSGLISSRKINKYFLLIIKPTWCTNFSNLFWNRTLHVSDRFSVHHQESSIVHTAKSICHTGYDECLLASSQHNLYDICTYCCVYSARLLMMDRKPVRNMYSSIPKVNWRN